MRNKKSIKLSNTLKITHEDLYSIIDKGINGGGSLHWLYDAVPKAENGIILLYGVDNRFYELTKHKIIVGLTKALPYIQGDIKDIDPETADFIIQMAIFGKCIYD